ERRRDDYHSALALGVQARPQHSRGALHGKIRIVEEIVDASSSGLRGSRFRQFAVFGLKRGQRFGAALARIDVEREEARILARRDADIRLRPDVPPTPDFRLVGRGVMRPVPRARMLPGARANRLMARMSAHVPACVLMAWVLAKPRTCDSLAGARSGRVSGRRVDGKSGPAELGVP